MSGPVDIEYGPDAWHTPTQPEAYADLEQAQQVDAMREALRRLGDLADAVQRGGEDARGAWLISQREGLVAKMKTDAFLLDLRLAAQAARDLHAPKES